MASWQPDPTTSAIFSKLEHDPEVKRLLSAFRDTTGVRLRIAPLCSPSIAELEELAFEHPVCRAFVEASADARKHCLQVHSALHSEATKTVATIRKSCAAGFIHVAMPLSVRGQPVALLEFAEVETGALAKKDAAEKVKRLIHEEFAIAAPDTDAQPSDLANSHTQRELDGLLHLLNALLPWLQSRATQSEGDHDNALPSPLYRATEFAKANFGDPEKVTLTAVAKEVGVTPRWLRKLFRDYRKTTFNKWLTRHRILMASQRLRDSNQPILEIALSCGFTAMTSFHRAFKAQTGITPSLYRKCIPPTREVVPPHQVKDP